MEAEQRYNPLVDIQLVRRPAIHPQVPRNASRFNGTPSTDNMPDHTVVYKQFETLTARLQAAYAEPLFATQWKGVSGTVIMKSVFTMERFYKGCKNGLCNALTDFCGAP